MQSSELRRLIEKYLNHSISAEEFSRLWETLHEHRFDNDWHEAIDKVLSDRSYHGFSNRAEAERRLAQINQLIQHSEENPVQQAPGDELAPDSAEAPVLLMGRYRFLKYAAAIILLLTSGIYLLVRNAGESSTPGAAKQQAMIDSIKPGMQTAMLTLGDGTVVVLDSIADGTIAQQGKARVIKSTGGRIKYQSVDGVDASQDMVYNTMTTPRGGQYQLTLPDGSNVWLNAASSITYPTSFPGDFRKVTVTGEVYFEVAKDRHKPFRVEAGDQQIEVLGTHFNINAYGDGSGIKTSLLEGSVKVNSAILQPGQAYMNGKVSPTDVEQDVAWKNGIFNFNNQTLAQVMRQLARWYNIEVVYPQGVPKKEYGGEIGRNLSLEQVLKGLESTGVHFQLDGRRLVVKS